MRTPQEAAIISKRGKIYGDPRENHEGIAQMWAPMLRPWAEAVGRGDPLPPHVVALLMALLKIDRMRLVYHADNYPDAINYLRFADEFQRDMPGPSTENAPQGPEFGEDPWIALASGRQFHFFGDKDEEIDIDDIAHALAFQCRYKGHCSRFFSVAEHCVLVSSLVPASAAIDGLLHDAAEFVLGDAPAPIKGHLGRFAELERDILFRIYGALGIALPEPESLSSVKNADRIALAAEARALFTNGDMGWCCGGVEVGPGIEIVGLEPLEAKRLYLETYRKLKALCDENGAGYAER